MRWHLSNRADPPAVAIADRHYSRQSPGTPQFVRPGRCLVLLTEARDALWVTSWPFPEYVTHAWADAWDCSWFRNESAHVASELITEAVAATRWSFGEPPSQGFITTVDPTKVKPTMRRGVPIYGYCFLKAGWTQVAERTKGGLIVYQLLPADMPEPHPFNHAQLRLIA